MDLLSRLSWCRAALLALLPAAAALAAPAAFREADVKAIFLLRFGSFAEWPTATLGGSESEWFTIGVLGHDPVEATLEAAVRGETVGGRPVRVVRFEHVSQVDGCAILFISRSESENLGGILRELRGRPILTVSDIYGFLDAGGMVRFVTQGQRIRLRVNVPAVRAAGLSVSSKLLRVVEVVGGTSNGA